jgi:hypothetical protein
MLGVFVTSCGCFIGPMRRREMQEMQNDTSDLDELRSAYKAAVEEWIAAIK